MKKGFPGFFSRLSTLIVIQMVFIFVSLGLILHTPDNGDQVNTVFEDLAKKVGFAARSLSAAIPGAGIHNDTDRAALDGLLDELSRGSMPLVAVWVVCLDSSEQVRLLYQYRGDDSQSENVPRYDQIYEESIAGSIGAMYQLPLNQPIATLRGDDHSVFYDRLSLADGSDGLMASIVRHDLFISRRGDMSPLLLLLFVAAAGMSVLTVFHIRKAFQKPLDRLVDGLERTGSGELCEIEDDFSDPELNKLARVFTEMSRTLFKEHQKLTESYVRQNELNATLQESQMFLSSLVKASPLCIVAATPSGEVMLFNERAERDFGYSAAEAVDLHIQDLFSGPLSSADDDSPRESSVETFETRCARKTGDFFPAFVASSPARLSGEKVIARIYIIRDITESKGFQDMMVRLDRYYTRGEMAGDIAHEINNYLAILMGNIELLPIILRKNDPEKLEKKLALMKTTAEKIATFTDGLMDVPAGDGVFEPADLNQLVENVLAFLKPQNKFDDIELFRELSSDLPLVQMDCGQIQQLLVNYVYNSADAERPEGAKKWVRVVTNIIDNDGVPSARIEIRDNGSGVDKDKEDWLFNKRFTTKRKGHGIGLITCRRIADVHVGTVGYHYDEGAVFSCSIPVIHPEKINPVETDPGENEAYLSVETL